MVRVLDRSRMQKRFPYQGEYGWFGRARLRTSLERHDIGHSSCSLSHCQNGRDGVYVLWHSVGDVGSVSGHSFPAIILSLTVNEPHCVVFCLIHLGPYIYFQRRPMSYLRTRPSGGSCTGREFYKVEPRLLQRGPWDLVGL